VQVTEPRSNDDLHPPGSYGPLRTYLNRLWGRRGYIVHVPRHDLRSRNMNSVLGNVWHLLNPILSITIYYLIFGLILDTRRGVEHFIAFLAIGVFAFQYTQKSTTAAAGSLVSNTGLLRSISFPRAMLPLTSVVTETLAFLPGILVFFAVAATSGADVRAAWLLVPLLVVLQLLFNVGAALIAARLTHGFRDIENLLPFVFRLLFYASGVLFSVDAYLDDDRLRILFIANPLFSMLALYRWAVLGMPAVWTELLAVGLWTVVLLVVGLHWFRRGEASYGSS
jgi:teichoic acid transport system permease protein